MRLNPYSSGSETVGSMGCIALAITMLGVLILILLEVRPSAKDVVIKDNSDCLNPYSSGSETVGLPHVTSLEFVAMS